MTMLMLGLQIASTALGAASQYSQGQAQSQAAEQSAAQARTQALQAQREGNYNAGLIQAKGQSLLGEQTAAYGAAGVVSGTGTPLEVALKTTQNVEMDALSEKYKAKQKSNELNYQAGIYDAQAEQASKAGTIGAMGTLISGGLGVAKSGAELGAWKIPGWNK